MYKFYKGEPTWEPPGTNWTYICFPRISPRTTGIVPQVQQTLLITKKIQLRIAFLMPQKCFHVMDIELVHKEPSKDSFSVIWETNIQTTINEKLVRAYKFDVSASQSLNIDRSSCAHLLICINGEISALNKTIQKGEYIFFNANSEVLLTNKQNNAANCVLLELK